MADRSVPNEKPMSGGDNLSRRGEENRPQFPLQTGAGDGWEVRLTPAYRDGPFLTTIAWNIADPMVELLDPETSQLLAQIRVQRSPFVLVRRTAHELLISDFKDTIGQAQKRLLVFDTQRNLTLKGSLDLPKRSDYPVYAPSMVLSNDERYLFYGTHEQAPGCVGDAVVCSVYGLGIVALDDLGNTALKLVTLPRDSGYAHLNPVGDERVVVSCSNIGVVQLIDHTGNVVQQDSFAAIIPEGFRRRKLRSLYGVYYSDGRLGVLLENGVLLTREKDGSIRQDPVLANASLGDAASWNPLKGSQRVAFDQTYQAGDKVIVGVHVSGALRGVVAYNLITRRVERVTDLPNGMFVTPTAKGDTLFVLRQDGTIESQELATGRERRLPTPVSGGEKVLAGAVKR
jgi:hypothetical protein